MRFLLFNKLERKHSALEPYDFVYPLDSANPLRAIGGPKSLPARFTQRLCHFFSVWFPEQLSDSAGHSIQRRGGNYIFSYWCSFGLGFIHLSL